MALHDPRPDFDEERGWQSDMERPRSGAVISWVFIAAGCAALAWYFIAPYAADAAYARPAICHGYATECTAAAQGEM